MLPEVRTLFKYGAGRPQQNRHLSSPSRRKRRSSDATTLGRNAPYRQRCLPKGLRPKRDHQYRDLLLRTARDRLAPALKRAAAAIPTKVVIPILQSVLVEISAVGLFVSSTDADVTYREQVDDIAREPWCGCVDAQRLHAFVDGAQADSVALRADDEDRLRISAGRASCRLPLRLADKFPRLNRPSQGVVEIAFESAAFLAGLHGVAGAMSDEQSRFYLSGAYLHAGKLCATDGNRLHLRTRSVSLWRRTGRWSQR